MRDWAQAMRGFLLPEGRETSRPPLVETVAAFVLAFVLVGVCLTLPVVRETTPVEIVLYLAAACLGDLLSLRVGRGSVRTSMTLFEAALLLSAIMEPYWVTLLMPLVAVSVAAALKRETLLQWFASLSTHVAAAGLLVLVYRAVAGTDGVVAGALGDLSGRTLGGLILAALAYTMLSSVLRARQESLRLRTSFRAVLGDLLPPAWIAVVASVALSTVLVVVYRNSPVLLPVLGVAILALAYVVDTATRTDRDAARLAQLSSLSQLLTNGNGHGEDLLGSFLDLVRRTFGADAALMVLAGPAPSVVVCTEDGVERRATSAPDLRLLNLDLPSSGVLDVQDVPAPYLRGVAVPLEGEQRGVVVVASSRRRNPFTSSAVSLLTTLVGSLVAARQSDELSRHIQAITASQAEAIISLGVKGEVTFLNPVAEDLVGRSLESARSKLFETLLVLESVDGAVVDVTSVARTGIGVQGREGVVRVGDKSLPVIFSLSPIRPTSAAQEPPGVVLALTDVTDEQNARRQLSESQESLAHLGRVLQQSLLPPTLPEVPTAQLAARYHAGADGLEVGGDFYDVFEILEDSWAVVIGDVCGRGAEAAAVTSLARHTMRAAATRETSPARLLETLNSAILRHHGDDRFCTVAAARLRLSDSPSIRVACAGHPSPYLVRPGGVVREIGEPGTLLGVLPDVDIFEEEVPLLAGDVLVFFTDGVIEARSPSGEMFGDSYFQEFLKSCALLPAGEVVERLEDALADFRQGPPDDDTAFLVVTL